MASARSRLWLPGLLLAALAAPSDAADPACERPDLVLPAGPRVLLPGAGETLDVFLQNTNPTAVTVQLNVTAPKGWRAALESERIPLGPRTPHAANATLRKLTLTAPQRGAGVASGDLIVTAQSECAGILAPSNAAAVSVPVRLGEAPIVWLYVGLGGVLAGAVAVAVWRGARARALVRFGCPDPEREVEAGKGVSFPLHLENTRSRPEVVVFRLEGAPLGWSAFVPLTEVTLEPGEATDLWLLVRAPPYAAPGTEARVVVRAEGRQSAPIAPVVVRARVRAR